MRVLRWRRSVRHAFHLFVGRLFRSSLGAYHGCHARYVDQLPLWPPSCPSVPPPSLLHEQIVNYMRQRNRTLWGDDADEFNPDREFRGDEIWGGQSQPWLPCYPVCSRQAPRSVRSG